MIRISSQRDSCQLANIHKNAYASSHFTANMPKNVLQKYYDLFYTKGVTVIISLAENEDGSEIVNGFAVFGSGIPELILRFENSFRLSIFKTGLRNPVLFLKKVLKRVKSLIFPVKDHIPSGCLLLSIASNEKGKGIGRSLMKEMLRMARDKGEKSIGLYVNIDNINAINVYINSGFLVKERLNDEYYMELSLNGNAQA